MNHACLRRSDSSLKLKHLIVCTPKTQDTMNRQCRRISNSAFQAPSSQGNQPTRKISVQTHAQFYPVENLSTSIAGLSSTAIVAGQGRQKQRQGAEKLLPKILKDPGN